MSRFLLKLLGLLLALLVLPGCSAAPDDEKATLGQRERGPDEATWVAQADIGAVVLEEELVALADTPAAISAVWSVSATGELVKKNDRGVIDYSNIADGYVMVCHIAETDKRLKVQVKGPTTTYTYNLTQGQWEAFPLSDGNGNYTIAVYQNVSDAKYSPVLSTAIQVELKDEFAPFLHSNQYVNYDAAPNSVCKAEELVAELTKPLEKVEVIYDYVINSLRYDEQKAGSVKSGYLPDLDTVLEEKRGICFDYAALMTGMLRSQGVPCKLVVGYAGSAYHAWISVWSAETGWVDGVVFFDGTSWQRMDPTFASSGKKSESIMAYIGDGKNYSAKYFY